MRSVRYCHLVTIPLLTLAVAADAQSQDNGAQTDLALQDAQSFTGQLVARVDFGKTWGT